MAKSPRRGSVEPANLDRWVISYADFITLLFAFFVVLYALSSVNEGKYKVLSDSLVSAFNVDPGSIQPIKVGDHVKRQTQIAEDLTPDILVSPDASDQNQSGDNHQEQNNEAVNLKQMANEIENAMAELIDKDLINIKRSENWLEIEIKTSILFPSGSATFVTASLRVLGDIAQILKGFPNPINVEGFTDNVPIRTSVFPSNWELSAGRAASVVGVFEKQGVDPRRMAAIGYGEHRTVADNRTAQGRNQNRRVVLAILAKDAKFGVNFDRKPINTEAREKTIPLHEINVP